MNDERQLVEGLRSLARSMDGRQAPPRVEAALLAEFRRRRAARNVWLTAAAAAAALAAVVIAAGVLLPRRPPQVAMAPARRVAQAPSPPVSAGERAAPKPAVVHRKTARRFPGRVEFPSSRFVPVLYSDDLRPMESGQIVRVRLPRSALASFGIPAVGDQPDDRIQTDVLLGEDGMARAVRFVSSQH